MDYASGKSAALVVRLGCVECHAELTWRRDIVEQCDRAREQVPCFACHDRRVDVRLTEH